MKIFKIILVFLFSLFFVTAYSSNLSEVNIKSSNEIEFYLDGDLELNDVTLDETESFEALKILRNIEISLAEKDFEDNQKLVLSLNNELKPNKNYSLFSIDGTQGNIDFTTPESLDNIDILNDSISEEEKGISKIVLVDFETIELYFNYEILEDEFEFKLFNEVSINQTVQESNKLSVVLNDKLFDYNEYIVMFLSIKDSLENEILFDEDLYDFKTELIDEDSNQDIPEEEIELVDTELGFTPQEESDKGNIEEIALNSAKTPDTGATTNILIFLTFLITSFIYIKKYYY